MCINIWNNRSRSISIDKINYKIGSTSYVYPADILTNVEKLKDIVDGIQLILFDSSDEVNLPNSLVCEKLKEIKERHNLEYYIHLPLDINFAVNTDKEREQLFSIMKNMVEIGESIDSTYYIAHLNFNDNFMENTEINLDHLFKEYPIKDRFLIENIEYPINHLDHFLYDYGLNLCMDIGHLLLQDQNIHRLIEKYTEKIKIVHFHAVDPNKKDHKSLIHYNQKDLEVLINTLKTFNISTYIIEVFEKKGFFESYDILNKYIDK